MKYRLIAALAVLLCAGATLFGQDLAGTWQGTLDHAGRPMRVVFKITKAADGKFTGQGFSIDQGGSADSDELDLSRGAHREMEAGCDKRQLTKGRSDRTGMPSTAR